MTHIDEHILELFVLGAAEVRDQRDGIETHLQTCARCRDLIEQMKSFYKEADVEFNRHPQFAPTKGTSLVHARQELAPLFEGIEPSEVQLRPAGLRRVQAFARRHPFMSGAGTFALGVTLFLAGSTMLNSPFRDRNPVYTHYNLKENTVEVYNRRDEKLWQKPTLQAADIETNEMGTRVRRAVVGDLDGTGHNKVVTTIPMWNDDQKEWISLIRGFDADGTLLFETNLNQTTRYRGRKYASDFYAHGITIMESPGGTTRTILVNVTNHRSPFFLARLDHRGNLLGEYWHFGHLIGAYEIPKSDPREDALVALCGVNDVGDSTYETVPVIVIVDPSKITGIDESTATPGFGKPESGAERFYIRLPQTDMARALGIVEGARYLRYSADPNLTFCVEGTDDQGTRIAFDYTFTKEMKISSVKPMSGVETIHARLLAEGKISSTFDSSYTENLKKGIQYWDGRDWRTNVVRVGERTSLATKPN